MSENIDSVLNSLFSQVNENVLVLTPNKRLSRFLHRHYARYQQQKKCSAWRSLECVSYSAWVQQLWDDWIFSPHHFSSSDTQHQPVPEFILSASQESFIWQEIIQQYCDTHDDLELFNASATTRVAKSAWQTLSEWNVSLEELLTHHASHETDIFVQWSKSFQQYCLDRNLADSASQLRLIRDAINHKQVKLPQKIILVAFDELSPLAESVLLEAQKHKCQIEYLELSIGEDNDVTRLALDDANHEIILAAKWALRNIERNPDASVGIVIPDLANNRDRVETIFRQVFEPQYILPGQARHASGFNMSAGQTLAKTPPIAAALLGLKLNLQELDIEDVSHFLHSPFLGAIDELPGRAMLNLELRESFLRVSNSALRASVSEFGSTKRSSKPARDEAAIEEAALQEEITEQHETEASESQDVPDNIFLRDLYARLQQLHQESLQHPKRQAPSAWAKQFIEQLKILGWPGQRSLDTLEFQQVNVWQELISEYAQLDAIYKSFTVSEALQHLNQVALDTQFQAQTTTSPVQILGVLEAAGMLFDHLWVMNLDNDHWPPAPKPNALLPVQLQKKLKMPRSSAEKELVLAERLTLRFASSANDVIFSHASRDGDKSLFASALIEAYDENTSIDTQEDASQLYPLNLFQMGQLEQIVDIQAAHISSLKELKGGTQILKDQAACPFRSFAKHRLNAQAREDAVAGLNAADRGSLIHNALEHIWNRLKTQKKLLSLSDDQLSEELWSAIRQSFYRLPKNRTLGNKLRGLEQQRIYPLLRAWMELEKQRTPFIVMHSEATRAINLAGLPISIRYDRVDQLEDGKLFIIDYKTGKLELRHWAGQRPDEPQVPIYCVANEQKVSGAAIGQVNIDQVAFKGLALDAETAPGISTPESLMRLELPDSWPEILQHWHDVLEKLASEFVEGEARVEPKNVNTSCQFCALHSLCRIREEKTDSSALEDELLGGFHE